MNALTFAKDTLKTLVCTYCNMARKGRNVVTHNHMFFDLLYFN